jgi:hypothetical protein
VGVEAATALRQEHRLKLFEQNVLRILGTKREEATAGWRKLRSEYLHKFYVSLNSIREITPRRPDMGEIRSTNEKQNCIERLIRREDSNWKT